MTLSELFSKINSNHIIIALLIILIIIVIMGFVIYNVFTEMKYEIRPFIEKTVSELEIINERLAAMDPQSKSCDRYLQCKNENDPYYPYDTLDNYKLKGSIGLVEFNKSKEHINISGRWSEQKSGNKILIKQANDLLSVQFLDDLDKNGVPTGFILSRITRNEYIYTGSIEEVRLFITENNKILISTYIIGDKSYSVATYNKSIGV